MTDDSAIIIRKVPVELRKALKIKAVQEGRTMQAILIDLIAKYVGMKIN